MNAVLEEWNSADLAEATVIADVRQVGEGAHPELDDDHANEQSDCQCGALTQHPTVRLGPDAGQPSPRHADGDAEQNADGE